MARILVIDDEPAIRGLLRQVLERAGHSVAEASNGREGIDQLEADDFEMVITDIVMPEREGIETIMRIKQGRPKTKIIVISGGGHRLAMDFLPVAKELGADLTFPKPFKPAEIIEAVDTLLGKAA
ncbi:MAG: response regulator [Inquilinus sp.]|nr:response regulator [Inquilinus sp.]